MISEKQNNLLEKKDQKTININDGMTYSSTEQPSIKIIINII